MRKTRSRRFTKWLIILLIIIGAVYWFSGFLNNDSNKNKNVTKPQQPSFSQMTEKQQQKVVNQAQSDAEAAARASGQNADQAAQIGKNAAQAAKNAIDRSIESAGS